MNRINININIHTSHMVGNFDISIFVFILISHFLYEFVLQPVRLVNVKTKCAYKKVYEERYNQPVPKTSEKDYLYAMMISGAFWACIVSIPIMLALGFMVNWSFLILIVCLAIFHSCIDFLKVGKQRINILMEQLLYGVLLTIMFVIFRHGLFAV